MALCFDTSPLFDKFHLRSMKYAAALIVKKALHLAIDDATPENILKLQKSLNRQTDLISPIWFRTLGFLSLKRNS